MGTTLVIPVMYGEIPEHVRHTFQLDNHKFSYAVLSEGETFPPADEVSGVIILYAENDHDMRAMQDMAEQVRLFYPGLSAIYLPVETEVQENLLAGLVSEGANRITLVRGNVRP